MNTLSVKAEVPIKFLKIEVAVRYGEEDIPNEFPLREGDMWIGTVDLDTKKIVGWPEGETGVLAMKVCDEGTYTLYDADMKEVAKIEDDYVPNEVVPGDFGDYIDLQIDETGTITNWPTHPDFSALEEDN